jgi:hypothetical protein
MQAMVAALISAQRSAMVRRVDRPPHGGLSTSQESRRPRAPRVERAPAGTTAAGARFSRLGDGGEGTETCAPMTKRLAVMRWLGRSPACRYVATDARTPEQGARSIRSVMTHIRKQWDRLDSDSRPSHDHHAREVAQHKPRWLLSDDADARAAAPTETTQP